jgi:DNA-binding response OmpR family regulator
MKKPLILVVDDCAVELEVTRLYLINAGFEVITRSRPIGTTAEILRMKPDLVLLDVLMPGLTGDKITKLIKESGLATKIVLHSGKENNELRELSKECGADGYIKKTNDKHEFINKVKSFLSPFPDKRE